MPKLLKKIVIPVIFTLVFVPAFAQKVDLTELTKLSDKLKESSGLCVSSRNKIWSHNDSKGEPVLYGFDKSGNISDAIYVRKTNKDWEALTKDEKGNFYIGDFGNDDNKRRDLKIYIIPNPDSIPDKITDAGVISFSYSDQFNFPPFPNKRSFDMEAMILFNDSIYLFSKNRTEPFDGFTKMYRLPAAPGEYVAQLVDSVYLGPAPMVSNWVTDAAISPDHKKLVLLSHDKMWVFTCFNGANFFSGKKTTLSFPTFTQKEGVCFINNNELYISDEFSYKVLGGKLYYLNLANTKFPSCN